MVIYFCNVDFRNSSSPRQKLGADVIGRLLRKLNCKRFPWQEDCYRRKGKGTEGKGMEGKGRGKEKDMGKKGKKQLSRLYPIFLILIRIFSYCFPEINIDNNNTGGWEGSALYDQVCCWHPVLHAGNFTKTRESSNKAEKYVTTAPHREQCVLLNTAVMVRFMAPTPGI